MTDELLPGVSIEEIEAAIRESAAVKAEKKRVAKEMAAHAKSISPVEHGDYAAAWKAETPRGPNGDPRVVNRSYKAHFVEDGTPTIKEHAVAAKTAIKFGGTAGDVINGPKI